MEVIKPEFNQATTEKEISTCAEIMVNSEPWITLGYSIEKVLKNLKDSMNEVYTAKMNNEIVGVIIVQTKGAFAGYLKSIVVKEEWRGQNLGEAMMEFVENKMFSESTNVFLCVSSFNERAREFYTKRGYMEIGVIKDYVVEGYDEIIMRKTTGPINKIVI
ncbi:MAG: GNAT family N-acetyltransferase [Bacteroidota bacterium]